jgi:uroporphyrinogen III methyltransferase/synthase
VSVYLVGAGCGRPGLLTVDAREYISLARHIVYDRLIHPDILQLAPDGCEFHPVGKRENRHTMKQDDINELLAALGAAGEPVVRLKGGDPFVFGRGGEEAEYLESRGIPWRAVPGVTSALGGSLLAGLPATHRRNSSSVTLAAGHRMCGRDSRKDDYWRELASISGAVAFYMGTSNFARAAENLIANGKSPETPASLIHWGGWARARRIGGTLGEFARMAEEYELPSPSVIYIGDASGIKLSPETGPLAGMQTAVCRPYPECWNTGRALEKLGADCYGLPLLSPERIDPDIDPAGLKRADWLVLTSPRGADRLAGILGDTRGIGRVASIGRGTSEALRRAGIIPDLEAEGSSASLAEMLGGAVSPGESVIFARNERGSDIAADAARSAGASVRIVPTYRMIPRVVPGFELMKEQWESCGLDAVIFGSSEMVRECAERVEIPRDASLVAWGAECAGTVQRVFGRKPVTMPSPDLAGLIAVLNTGTE